MFDQSNLEKPALYSQTLARWPDERTEKQFNPFFTHFQKCPSQTNSWGILMNAILDHEDRIKEQVEHAKIHLDRPVKFWKNVLLRDVTKLNVFGLIDQQYVWCKQGKAYEQMNTIPIKNMEVDQYC